MRPVLVLPVFGARFGEIAARQTLATLLSPGNLPALDELAVVYLYADEEARSVIERSPIWPLLARSAEVVWHMIGYSRAGVPPHITMSRGHLAGSLYGAERRAMTMLLCADQIVADGSLPRALRAARGRAGVLAPFWAVSGGPAMMALEHYRRADGSLDVWASDAADIAIRHVSPLFRGFEFDSRRFGRDTFPHVPWWRVSHDHLVVHALVWDLVVVNYAEIAAPDMRCLESLTFDFDHAYRNEPRPERWNVIQDSDVFLALFAEHDHAEFGTEWPDSTEEERHSVLCAARRDPTVDPLRRAAFAKGYALHSCDLGTHVTARDWYVADLVTRTALGSDEPAWPFRYPPVLLESVGDKNFVAYQSRVYVVPQALGPLSLDKDEDRGLPGITEFGSLDEARRSLAA